MKIIIEKTAPNGAVAASHTIETLTIRDGQAVALVESRTSADQLAWQEPVPIDLADLRADPLSCAAAVLIGGGGYLEGGVIAASETPEQVLRATLLSRVDRQREKMVDGGCETGLGRVQTDEVSIRNLLGSVQTAAIAQMTNQAFEIDWRMEDNSLVSMNAGEMIAVGVEVMKHIQRCYAISWEIKDFIRDATIEEVDGIDIAAEWTRLSAD